MLRTTLPLAASSALMLLCVALADPPATQPAGDETLDWLLKQAATAPATEPAPTESTSRPTSPFADKNDRGWRKGVITLSNGEKVRGNLQTTRDKPLRVWEEKAKEYRDIPFELVKSMQARIVWERDEKEWAFKESGSDVKIYTGKTYPARELTYTLTLVNDQTVSGGLVAPIYIQTPSGDKTFLLNKRQKGEVGQNLKQLEYVKGIELE